MDRIAFIRGVIEESVSIERGIRDIAIQNDNPRLFELANRVHANREDVKRRINEDKDDTVKVRVR